MRELIATVWVIARISQPLDWIVPPTDILAAIIAFIMFVVLLRSERINLFTNEVITELGEVVWPGKKETVFSTGIVSVLVGICSVILFGFDMVWGMMVRLFYR